MSVEFLRLLICSIPACFFPFIAALIFLGEDVKKHMKKAIILGLAFGFISWGTYQFEVLQNLLRLFLNIAAAIILIKILFRRDWWQTIKLYLVYFVFQLSADITSVLVIQYILNKPFPQVVNDPVVWLKVFFPMYIITIPIAYPASVIRTRFNSFWNNIKERFKIPRFKWLVITTTAQIFLLISIIIEVQSSLNYQETGYKTLLLMLALLLFIIINIVSLINHIRLAEEKVLQSAQDALSDNIMALINSVRSQRHDFVNHLQVIMGLSQMGNLPKLNNYISQLTKDINVSSNLLKISNPIISALLNAKITQAELKDVRLEIEISTGLDHLTTKVLDLNRIIGNLINNAIDAVEHLEQQDRWVKVVIAEKGPFLSFTVSNPCSQPAESLEKLFEPGFTTKDDTHNGLGLYICQQLAQKLHGKIEYNFDPAEGVRFELVMPK